MMLTLAAQWWLRRPARLRPRQRRTARAGARQRPARSRRAARGCETRWRRPLEKPARLEAANWPAPGAEQGLWKSPTGVGGAARKVCGWAAGRWNPRGAEPRRGRPWGSPPRRDMAAATWRFVNPTGAEGLWVAPLNQFVTRGDFICGDGRCWHEIRVRQGHPQATMTDTHMSTRLEWIDGA